MGRTLAEGADIESDVAQTTWHPSMVDSNHGRVT